MNGNMIPEEWKENFKMSERSFIFCVKSYDHNSQTNHKISQTNICRETNSLYLVLLIR